jgi:hypothetical protein
VAFDGRNGTTYQRMILIVNSNYNIGAIVGIIVLGIFPLIGLIAFAIGMCFVKVPSIEE